MNDIGMREPMKLYNLRKPIDNNNNNEEQCGRILISFLALITSFGVSDPWIAPGFQLRDTEQRIIYINWIRT
jgi:hypothetical protein